MIGGMEGFGYQMYENNSRAVEISSIPDIPILFFPTSVRINSTPEV